MSAATQEEQHRREGVQAALKILRHLAALESQADGDLLVRQKCIVDTPRMLWLDTLTPYEHSLFATLNEYIFTALEAGAPDPHGWTPQAPHTRDEWERRAMALNAKANKPSKTKKSRGSARPASNVIPWPGRGRVQAVSPASLLQ